MTYLFSVHLIEIASTALFFLALRGLFKEQRQKSLELLGAFAYGLLLEELDIYLFRTYRYGPGFFLQLGNAPLAIAFLWGLILISSMALSDRMNIPEFSRPFADGLLALLMDIGVDAVAIRIGYWKWTIPLSEGWFGVPAGNLYSWMWVAFSYSAVTRVIRWLAGRNARRSIYQFLSPAAAYLILLTAIVAVGIAGSKLGLDQESERLWIFYGHVIIFAIAVGMGGRLLKGRSVAEGQGPVISGILRWSRLAIHIYFLAALCVTGMIFSLPQLGGVAAGALAVEMMIQRRAGRSG